jgi:hypothetical protein
MHRLLLTTWGCYQDIRFAYELILLWRQHGEVRALFYTYAIFWTHLWAKRISDSDNQPGMHFFPYPGALKIGIHTGEWRGHMLLLAPTADSSALRAIIPEAGIEMRYGQRFRALSATATNV